MPSAAQQFLLVLGVQRSGTNMIIDPLDASPEADVYHETHPRAFENYMLRDEVTLACLRDASAFPLFVIKGLHETERIRRLIGRFAPGQCI